MSTIALDRSNGCDTPRVRHLHAVPDATSPIGVRLTRRGKTVILVAAMAIVTLLVIMFGASTAATDLSGPPLQTRTVTVTAGQTLWQVAAAANPNGDIRATVDDIVRINSLPNASSLQMGSQIAVPVYK